MPKIFLILSAVLLLLSSGLSYLNKSKLTTSLNDAKDAHQQATTAQADSARAKQDLKKSQQTAQEATQHAADVQKQYDEAKATATRLEGDVKTATDNLATKEKDLAELNAKLAALSGKPTNDGAPSVDIVKQMEDLKRQKDELQLVKDSMETQLKSAQVQLAAAAKRSADIENKSAMLGLRGRVLAVNREYNFVVLDLGSRNGVSGNATMIVQRGGSLVGRIRTVSVEPSQTVADIVPNSVPAGVVVQPGDTVIFPGS